MAACPCCGVELPLGLFEREAYSPYPDAVQRYSRATHQPVFRQSVLMESNNRYYLMATGSIPITWPESPVVMNTWLEITPVVYGRLVEHMHGQGKTFAATATLASDIPGFPGSVGTRVVIEARPSIVPRIVHVEDPRLLSLPERPNHEQLVALYRRMFGFRGPVKPADEALREIAEESAVKLFARPYWRRPVMPPAAFAGVEPGELLVAPPKDTGGLVTAVTLGTAEGLPANMRPFEVGVWARNPIDPFLDSFSEFAYFSRSTGDHVSVPGIVPEWRDSIPGTAEQMRGWLLCEPWWVEQDPGQMRIVAAIPITMDEMKFCRMRGPAELVEILQHSDVDVFDLTRDSLVQVRSVSEQGEIDDDAEGDD